MILQHFCFEQQRGQMKSFKNFAVHNSSRLLTAREEAYTIIIKRFAVISTRGLRCGRAKRLIKSWHTQAVSRRDRPARLGALSGGWAYFDAGHAGRSRNKAGWLAGWHSLRCVVMCCCWIRWPNEVERHPCSARAACFLASFMPHFLRAHKTHRATFPAACKGTSCGNARRLCNLLYSRRAHSQRRFRTRRRRTFAGSYTHTHTLSSHSPFSHADITARDAN